MSTTEAAEATGSGTEAEAPPNAGLPRLIRGFKVWFAVSGGVWTWTVHLLFVSSFVRFDCNAGGLNWVEHLMTAAMAGLTVVAMALCIPLLRSGSDAEDAPTESGRNRFLGMLGLLIGGINLALILLEGSYVFFLKPCA